MTALDETTTFNEDADSLLILKSMSRPHQAKDKTGAPDGPSPTLIRKQRRQNNLTVTFWKRFQLRLNGKAWARRISIPLF